MPGAGAHSEEGGGGEGAAPGAGPEAGAVAGREPSRLCGYLQKLSGKGPLRGYRSRWFVFDSRRCYLYYFKSPQDALPLGHLDIADACFSYQDRDEAAEPGADPPTHFQVHSAGAVTVLKAPNRELMTYWLQELQQKRWEYCNSLDMVKWDSGTSPTLGDFPKGLVARDNTDIISQHPNPSAEKARTVLAVEAAPGELVGDRAAQQPAPGHPNSINFYSLKQWGNELKNSMSSFRPGRAHSESRRTVFYTNEEWELLDPPPKDLEESLVQEERKKQMPEGSKGVTSSGFPFEFGRNPYKGKRPLKDIIGSYKNRHSSSDPLIEGTASGSGCLSKPVSEMQLQIQSQQEELEQLKKDLSSQKELIRLLQQTVRSSQYDKYFTSHQISQGVPRDTLELLHQKDEQILGLSSQLERFGLEKESLQQEVRTLKNKVGELNERLGMLMETIQAKDEVIIKLSECEGNVSSPTMGPTSPLATPTSRDQLELDRLKDSLQGYKTQNKFLNKEILELSALRRNAERRERDLMAKYSSLEAKLCQIESKYLILLQEMKTPVCSEEQGPARDVIAQLLEDALQVESQEQPEQAFVKPHLVRLVAVALLYLEQEDAFWCLVTIVEVFMPRDYYTKTLLGSQVDQRVFRDLMSEKLPRLHTHFEQYKVDYTLITFNWFLVVFVDSVVSDILFKIWDSFLYEGPKVIFRFALALFKYKEEEILKLQDSMSIFKYLRYFTRTILDARKLISISFGDLNPFPLRQIRNRRAYHLEKVRLELTELEAIREDFLRERDTTPDKGELVSDEEEDT
ncbi:TBC1 domain family member 2B isoform X3 [Meriones unguiculatus]|uniref:TBC1 domain family member 2B isoform X3 n=1 Tax=Meriones unguiculatus TaxID=10047 RepID=UPI00293E704F|nr:TBC1 domain family member 2B isoform X3 [Meriones unguiculatus]